jgi:hypothetical protein
VLEGSGRGDGVLWVSAGEATTVGIMQGAAGQRGGVRVCSSSSPPSLAARVGAGEAGLDSGDVQEHGYRAGANVNSVAHSRTDFSGFFTSRCSIKCPQEFKFRIFENCHCGLSTYWTRVPGVFLLQRNIMFCRNPI